MLLRKTAEKRVWTQSNKILHTNTQLYPVPDDRAHNEGDNMSF